MTHDGFDQDLKRALRAEAYRSPLAVDPEALRARVAADASSRRRLKLATVLGGVGTTVAAAAIVAIALVTRPAFSPSVGASASGSCDVSTVASHGSWWKEVGGRGAFFNAEPTNYFHASPFTWLIITRFDPAPPAGAQLTTWADRLGSTQRVAGTLNSPMDPKSIYNRAARAPQLPGGWYLFEQRFPVPGCWRLSAVINGQVVGTATLRVEGAISASLPLGIFMTSQKVDSEPCYAFEVTHPAYEKPTEVQAWYWAQGEGGDCRTRTSDVVPSRATITPEGDSGYEVALGIPLLSGGTQEIRVSLYPQEGALAGVDLSAGNAATFFTLVPSVSPSFAPVH